MAEQSPAKSVTEARIVEAAAQLFARHGFKAATTRQIARLADLNEVTLFRYFVHKPDLFWAAVESRLRRLKLAPELLMCLGAGEAPALVVPKIVNFLLQSLAQQPDLPRLLYVAAFELPGADRVIGEHLGPILEAIRAYFEGCAEKGLIHPAAAPLVTLGILGTAVAHCSLRRLLPGAYLFASLEEEAAACSNLWLRALLPNMPEQNLGGPAANPAPAPSLS